MSESMVRTGGPMTRPRRMVEAVDWEALTSVLPGTDDDATERIVASILGAENPDDVNAPWAGEGMRGLFGHEIRIWSVRRGESRFKEGNPYFVIVEAFDLTAGQEIVTTSSSSSVLATCVKFHISDWFPADFKVTPAKQETKDGNLPYHLEYLGRPVEETLF